MSEDHNIDKSVGGSGGQDAGGDGYESITPVDFEPTAGIVVGSGFARHHGLKFAIYSLLALIALGAWYIFSGSSVLIRFEPEAEVVELDGVLLDLELDGRRLLRPGQYTVRASLDGYRDFEQQIDIDQRNDQEFIFQLTKLPGLLNLFTPQTPEARVFVNGEPVGPHPWSATRSNRELTIWLCAPPAINPGI